MLLLKLAGLPYRTDRNGYFRAPKGKLPYIDDDGTIIADSTFIRFHIEKKYGFDFDLGLTAEQKAAAWAVEKMCEDHLHLALLATRWLDEANFSKGPAQFFKALPLPIRPVVRHFMRRRVEKTLHLQGFGRHNWDERNQLAIKDIQALSDLIGAKGFLMGETPCGADATVFAYVGQFLTPVFDTPLHAAAEKCKNLVDYRDRILQRYFDA